MNVMLKKQNDDAHHVQMEMSVYWLCMIGSRVNRVTAIKKHELKKMSVHFVNRIDVSLKMK